MYKHVTDVTVCAAWSLPVRGDQTDVGRAGVWDRLPDKIQDGQLNFNLRCPMTF